IGHHRRLSWGCQTPARGYLIPAGLLELLTKRGGLESYPPLNLASTARDMHGGMHVTTATATSPKGRYRPAKRPSPPMVADQRTRVAKRIRALEREYCAMLTKQGVVIDVHVDMTVGALADAMVRVEIARAAASRGVAVDHTILTRWVNL